MKKLLLPLLALVFLISCEKESTTDLQPEEQSYENGSATTRSSEKRDVCHNGKIKNVSIYALPGHVGHGDAVDWDDDGYFSAENDCDMPIDCDDNNEAVNPGAIEICDNAIDDDCDGNVDEADSDCSTSCVPEGIGEELEVTVNDPSGPYTLYVYPVDNSNKIPWSNNSSNTGATDHWDGNTNTDAIVADQGPATNYAAGLCASLKDDGCDWYLPSINELKAMYQKFGQGGTSGNNEMEGDIYWSSTEFNDDNARLFPIVNGNQGFWLKGANSVNVDFRCRCVRR